MGALHFTHVDEHLRPIKGAEVAMTCSKSRAVRDPRPVGERLADPQKKCMRCREDKLKSEFAARKRNHDGLHSYCRVCAAEVISGYHKERRQKDWAFRLLQNARTSTSGGGNRKRQMAAGLRVQWEPVNLTTGFLHELYTHQGGKCAYFNIPLLLDGGMGLRSITLDRLNCEQGYVQGNVVLACRAANLARGAASADDMHVLVEMIKRS